MKLLPPQELRRRQQQRTRPEPVAPAEPYAVDVVVPFCAGDVQWLRECVDSLLAQQHCSPVIHVVSDNCEFPTLPNTAHVSAEIRRYRHRRQGQQGPYRLTNALVNNGHCQTPFLALQDCDDLSLERRLFEQISILEQAKSDMISSAMQQLCESSDNTLEAKRRGAPILYPGREFGCVPDGCSVNSTRTMRRDFFEALNGFHGMFCGGDFEFCMRARKFSRRIIDCMTVHGRRRLRMRSLSHGTVPHESPERLRNHKTILRHLEAVQRCRKCAPNFGSLRSPFKLEVV